MGNMHGLNKNFPKQRTLSGIQLSRKYALAGYKNRSNSGEGLQRKRIKPVMRPERVLSIPLQKVRTESAVDSKKSYTRKTCREIRHALAMPQKSCSAQSFERSSTPAEPKRVAV